jgi:hypothetical protein
MCKMDLELVNDGELHHLCSTLRFWAVEMPPNALIEHCYTMFSPELKEVAEEYGHALPYLDILAAIRKCKTADGRLCTALRSRNLPLLKYVIAIAKSTGSFVWTERHFELALEAGDYECLAFVVQEGCPQKLRAHYLTNSIQCLRYILTHCDDYVANFDAYCCIGDAELVDCLLSH